MKERPILFSGPMVRAILEGPRKRKLYPNPGQSPTSPEHLARRLANGLESAPEVGCWLWQRAARETGHGTLTVLGRSISAHRLAYELGVGPILDEIPWTDWRPGPIDAFMDLWNGINASRGFGWDANPWVWVIEFRKVEA